MAVKSRDKPKAVRWDDYTVHRRGAGKPVGVAQLFLTIIILTNPVAVVQTVSLIFSFGWMNAIALVVIIVGGMVIELILIHIHDSRVWKEIIGYYFRVFDECYFEPTKIELKGLKKIRDVLHYPLEISPLSFLIQFLMPSIRAFHVYPKPTSRILPSSPSSPKAYQMAGGTSYVFLPSKPKNNLRLMSVAAADGLVNEGRNLVIVALVGTDLHIRIFDASGKKVVDKAENELVSGETLTALKTQLNLVSDESGLSEGDKQNIIADATSIAGHIQIFVARFQLLHEIGHASVTNHIISKQGWFAVVYFCLLFVFVAFHREAGILALLVAFALAAMWAHYLVQQGNADERLELAADTFALVHLAGRPDFRTAIARAFRKQSKDRYRARPLVRRAQILSRTEEFSLEQGQGLNWLEHSALSIPLWLGLLILAGMLWLGTTLRIKDLEELLALSLVWVVVPGLVYYYRMFMRSAELPSTFWGRRKAVDFLQAHAPEYDLRLMSVAATKDLLDVGRNLIIVALVGTDLHIRIFDASGIKVIDKAENELIIDKTLTDLKNKKRLNPFHNESSLSKEEKQKIIRNAIFNLLFS